MSGRLFALSAAVALGAVIAIIVHPAPLLTLCVLGLCVAQCARRPRSIGWLMIVACTLGAMLAAYRLQPLEGGALATLAKDGRAVTAIAEVAAPPERRDDEVRVVVAVEVIERDQARSRIHERLLLTIRPPPDPALALGDRLRITELRPIPVEVTGFRLEVWRARHRLAARAYLEPDQVEPIGTTRSPIRRFARAARAAATATAARMPQPARGLFLGLTIGDTSQLDPLVDDDFRRTGLTHLVAVSGSNVAIVLGAVVLALRALRVPVGMIPWVLAATVVVFCATSAFEPSVVRAGVMASLVLGATLLGAARNAVRALGMSVLIISVADPFLPLTLGFQLSVAATLGLLTIARRLADDLAGRPVLLAGAATLGAQLATAPLLAASTGSLSLMALPANLLVAPFAGIATLVGFLALGAGMVFSPAMSLALGTLPPITMMLTVARLFAELPGAVLEVPGGVAGLAIVGGSIVVAILASRRGMLSRGGIVVLAVLIPLAGGVFTACQRQPPLDGLIVTMIDVGQGDALLVTLEGHAMLIDGGDSELDALQALRRYGVRRLDLLVVTHPHDDHISGLVAVARRTPIGVVLDPGLDAGLADYVELEQVIAHRRIPVKIARAGQRFPFGPARIDVLWPIDPLLEGTDSDLNENSVVLRVTYGTDTVLFAGETQEESQRALIGRGGLAADVVKVAHHGSARMLPEFYAATGAEVALIPVGRNRYGHPAAETLVALQPMQVYRSDLHGDVRVALDGHDGIQVRTERG